MKWSGFMVIGCLSLLLCCSFHGVSACKDIIACGDATEGEYNLLLKVRDPSRPGYQVLTMIPQGYCYEYHHPWIGLPLTYQFNYSMIGVATLGDTIPSIVKAGMCFTSAGICFGDADTITRWRNPSPFAWDDFDWIRYAAQTADDEDHAVELLTTDTVDRLHAPGVPENLFVVGPKKGFVVEADVTHYDVKEIADDVVVMSNYGKNLWNESFLLRMIAPSFDTTFEGKVTKGQIIRLGKGCIYGVKIIDIGTNYIEVKQIPIQFSIGNILGKIFDFFTITKVNLTRDETIGFYRVGLKNISNGTASISLCYEYYVWEQKMMEYITPSIGVINVSTLMNLSRIHTEDLDGLRGMCDDYNIYPYEGCMIYQIPSEHYGWLSAGWFSANHPCSSIYVPAHICVNDIYDPYVKGEAAMLSLELLQIYGHDALTIPFQKIEQVFINEQNDMRSDFIELINDSVNITPLLTVIDYNMQRQAYLTQQIYLNLSKDNHQELFPIIATIWDENYSHSLAQMKKSVETLTQINTQPYQEMIMNLSLNIVSAKKSMCGILGYDNDFASRLYHDAIYYFDHGIYDEGYDALISSFHQYSMFLR